MSRKFEIMRRIPAKITSSQEGVLLPDDDTIPHFVRIPKYFERTRDAEAWLREKGEIGETYIIIKISKKLEVYDSGKKLLVSMVI